MNDTSLRLPLIKGGSIRLRSRLVPVILALVAASGSARLGWSHSVDDLVAEQVAVRQLMELETAQALQRLNAAGARTSFRSPKATQGTDAQDLNGQSKPRLVAIYGVGPKLMAEIQIDDRTLLFMRGRAKPVGPGKSHPLRLVSITPPCVQLKWKEQQESLCASSTINSRG